MDGSPGVTNRPAPGRSGETWWTDGVDGRLSVRAVYAIVIGLIAAWTVVTMFSTARDISWRLGSPHNLWEPALWNVTSAIVGVALLPLVRRGALLFRDRAGQACCRRRRLRRPGPGLFGAAHRRHGPVARTGLRGSAAGTTRFRGPGKFPTSCGRTCSTILRSPSSSGSPSDRPAHAPVASRAGCTENYGGARGEAGAVAARRPHQRPDRRQRDRLGQFGGQLRGI